MLSRFNIALLPITKGIEFIEYAKNFSSMADQYQLGENALPHVTLCQFLATELELDQIWKQIYNSVGDKTINLTFKELNWIMVDGCYWVSLLPSPSPNLLKLHHEVANLIKAPIVSRAFEKYSPHLTLINTQEKNHATEVARISKEAFEVTDQFLLSLGESGNIGQFRKVIKKAGSLEWKIHG